MSDNVSAFAYVYIVYYLDPNESEPFQRLRNTQPIACTSLKRAKLFSKDKAAVWIEIDNGRIWRAGNYWIAREAIIDSFDHGLEFEILHHDGGKRDVGIMPLKFESEDSE